MNDNTSWQMAKSWKLKLLEWYTSMQMNTWLYKFLQMLNYNYAVKTDIFNTLIMIWNLVKRKTFYGVWFLIRWEVGSTGNHILPSESREWDRV